MSGSYEFPKRVRLNKQKDIERLFKNGIYLRAGILGIKYVPNEVGYSRFVISVKKQVGNAPYRNYVKRLLRESIRLRYAQLSGHYDVGVFMTQRISFPLTLAYISDQVSQFFAQLRQNPS